MAGGHSVVDFEERGERLRRKGEELAIQCPFRGPD